MPRKRRPARFSTVAAVKANARLQVGQPPAARPIAEKSAATRAAKHKPTLAQILSAPDNSAGDRRP